MCTAVAFATGFKPRVGRRVGELVRYDSTRRMGSMKLAARMAVVSAVVHLWLFRLRANQGAGERSPVWVATVTTRDVETRCTQRESMFNFSASFARCFLYAGDQRKRQSHVCARERALAPWMVAQMGTRELSKAVYSATNTVL